MDHSVLRQIPKMDGLLDRPRIRRAAEGLPRTLVRETIQRELDGLRDGLLAGESMPGEQELEERLLRAVGSAARFRLRRVVNATGVVLHTNLGRAPLGEEIAGHVARVAAGYSNLEFDLEKGTRGSRYAVVEELLCRLTGAEAALVVNNNAAAVFLMLNTLARGKRVAISRGELVEIGGSFRVPEIMAQSGAELMEVGTTNMTHPGDYLRAMEEGAEVLLKVHQSNFHLQGFTRQVEAEELKAIAGDRPVLYDLGAGFLAPPEELGLRDGVFVRTAVAQADVVCFSGDKLLGGGQAGILLGKKPLIDLMKRNQLTRMLRVDKLTLAALEGVLRWYLDPAQARERIPVLRMLSLPAEALRARAERLAGELAGVCSCCAFEAVPCVDEPGGGSLPGAELPGWAVAVTGKRLSPNGLETALRRCDTPVLGRIWKDRLILSLRTVAPEDTAAVTAAFAALEAGE